MWGLRSKPDQDEELKTAKAGQELAEAVIARLDSQAQEVTDIVSRLQKRERRNNFGEALQVAMERRAA